MGYEEMTEEGICSLCGRKYSHWGNNPEPLKDIEERCCDECNQTKVIPARLRNMGFFTKPKKEED